MSAATHSAALAATSPTPPLKPIDPLSGQYAFSYRNLHPVLLLSLLAISFPRLVADPVPTLLGLTPTLVLLQAGYCVVCLPSSGKAVPEANSKAGQPGKNVKGKAKGREVDLWGRVVPATLSLILTLTLAAPTLFIALVLFGAPLTTHQPHTALLALHLALLTAPPLFYVHGLDTTAWLRVASLQLPLDEVYGMALGACAGAWLGAIPIPLDWDRAWQRWPVTVVVGVYAGCVIGKVLGGMVVRGRRIKLS